MLGRSIDARFEVLGSGFECTRLGREGGMRAAKRRGHANGMDAHEPVI
jgi:hypothetical protein